MKNKKMKTRKNNKLTNLYKDRHSQMIVIMGIILAISVFAISSLSADISNLDIIITTERSSVLNSEFTGIKETFATSLNYNLAEKITIENGEMNFYGNISNITKAFNQTIDEFVNLELKYDMILEANLNKYWYAKPGSTDYVYHVNVTISLENQDTRISEDVIYSIVCRPIIT